jgi:hypothetical protein
LCCCHVVVVVFIYFVAVLPTPPPPPPLPVGVDVDGDGAQDNQDGVGRYLIVWAIKLSDGKIRNKDNHGLKWPPNTNKNTTTNQKHAGLMGKR